MRLYTAMSVGLWTLVLYNMGGPSWLVKTFFAVGLVLLLIWSWKLIPPQRNSCSVAWRYFGRDKLPNRIYPVTAMWACRASPTNTSSPIELDNCDRQDRNYRGRYDNGG